MKILVGELCRLQKLPEPVELETDWTFLVPSSKSTSSPSGSGESGIGTREYDEEEEEDDEEDDMHIEMENPPTKPETVGIFCLFIFVLS